MGRQGDPSAATLSATQQQHVSEPMSDRPYVPYVLLSCAMSLDGCIDDATGERLLLSNDADCDRVDAERAGCDAVLVGANTVRRDNPRLLVRSAARRRERAARGLPPDPVKVTLTRSGELDPSLRFFTAGDTTKVVYCPSSAVDKTRERLAGAAVVVDTGEPLDLHNVLADLGARGVGRLLVEGGGSVHTQFLTAGLADELQLVVAPFFVGDARAPRFVGTGTFPWDARNRMTLAEARQIGDVALLRYLLPRSTRTAGLPDLSAQDRRWLQAAIELSRQCPRSRTAFSVGAIIVDARGVEVARGFSREADPHDHAEERALRKAPGGGARLAAATIYSSLEPCSLRKSRPASCTDLILAAGIRRVVFAWREPPLFVDGRGTETLRHAGVQVLEAPDLAGLAQEINGHLLGPDR